MALLNNYLAYFRAQSDLLMAKNTKSSTSLMKKFSPEQNIRQYDVTEKFQQNETGQEKWPYLEVSKENLDGYIENHKQALLDQFKGYNSFVYPVPDLSQLKLKKGQILKIGLLLETAKKYAQEEKLMPLELKFLEAADAQGGIDWSALWNNQIKPQLEQAAPGQNYLEQKEEVDFYDIIDVLQKITADCNILIFSKDAFVLGDKGQNSLRHIAQRMTFDSTRFHYYFLLDFITNNPDISKQTSSLLSIFAQDALIIDTAKDIQNEQLQVKFETGNIIDAEKADFQTRDFLNKLESRIYQNKGVVLNAPRRGGASSILEAAVKRFDSYGAPLKIDMSAEGLSEKNLAKIQELQSRQSRIILLLDEVDITDLNSLRKIEKIVQETSDVHLILRLSAMPERLKHEYPEADEIINRIIEGNLENNLTVPYQLADQDAKVLVGKLWDDPKKFNNQVYEKIKEYTNNWNYFVQYLCGEILQESMNTRERITPDLVDKMAEKILADIINIQQTLDLYWSKYLPKDAQWTAWAIAQAVKQSNQPAVNQKQIAEFLKNSPYDIKIGLKQIIAEGIVAKRLNKYELKMKFLQESLKKEEKKFDNIFTLREVPSNRENQELVRKIARYFLKIEEQAAEDFGYAEESTTGVEMDRNAEFLQGSELDDIGISGFQSQNSFRAFVYNNAIDMSIVPHRGRGGGLDDKRLYEIIKYAKRLCQEHGINYALLYRHR